MAARLTQPPVRAGIIVGAPTWHTGADTERSGTAWDECAPLPLPYLASASAPRSALPQRCTPGVLVFSAGWLAARSSQPHPNRFIYGDLAGLDLKGKKVAIFGLGDQGGYGDNFCDAMDELKTCFQGSGAEIVGSWSTDGYDHMESKSVDGAKFVGALQPPAGSLQ